MRLFLHIQDAVECKHFNSHQTHFPHHCHVTMAALRPRVLSPSSLMMDVRLDV
jgi:hypothetical protein